VKIKNSILGGIKMGLVVETERLILVPLSEELWLKLQAVKNEDGEWPSEDVAKIIPDYIEKLKENPRVLGWGIWLTLDKNDYSVVGDIGFDGVPNELGEIKIGFGIVPSKRRQGYGFEAVKSMIDFILNKGYINKITAKCDKWNIASIRILEKAGMRNTGCDEKYFYYEITQ
jgi:ribosomal-protein-alanine N-acetyltransferase